MLGGDALSAIGTGLTLPFLIIYLNQARGISLSTAGAAVSVLAVAGFVGNPLGGAMADRVGAKQTLALGLVLSALGAFAIAGSHEAWQAFPAVALAGLGAAITWPAQDALLAVVVAPEQRSSVFSLRHATLNGGLGVGGLLAAALVGDGTSAGRFVTLFVVDGLTFLAFIPLVWTVRVYAGEAAEEAAESTQAGDWRSVVKDPVFRRIWLLTAALVAVGYGQFGTVFPAYAGRPGGIEPGAVGVAFAANTVGVVAFQLVALRLMTGRRRSTGVLLAASFWAVAWVVTLAGGAAGSGHDALALFALAGLVFAVGETFLSPALEPMVNDLATDELRGRYNGIFVLAWTTGYAVGPAVGGVALDTERYGLLFGGLIVLCVGLGAWGASLRRHVSAEIDMVTA